MANGMWVICYLSWVFAVLLSRSLLGFEMAFVWRRHQQRLRQAEQNRLSTGTSSVLAILLLVAVAVLWLFFYSALSPSVSDANVKQDLDRINLQVENGMQDPIDKNKKKQKPKEKQDCDYSQGSWIYDPLREAPYNETCSDIFKGWNCIRNQRSNSGAYLRWRWQPQSCDMPRLNPGLFLEKLRGKNIGFVGDSLNRNMYVSLVCTLKRAAGKELQKWRPIGSDKGITFLAYNVTVAYHRTNLLARYTQWKATSDGEELGYKVDVDIPQSTWSQAPQFYDILIMNTGHWWLAPEKFNPVTSPMLFFENGQPILPPKSPEDGLELTLKHMLSYVEQNMRRGGLKFLRTQSPRHFEGGDWKDGGSCHRSEPLTSTEVENMFALKNKGVNSEVRVLNKHLEQAAKATSFQLLNITHMSEFRADGHPSTSAKKLHEDCMHWCLPGVTDIWNDMLAALILS